VNPGTLNLCSYIEFIEFIELRIPINSTNSVNPTNWQLCVLCVLCGEMSSGLWQVFDFVFDEHYYHERQDNRKNIELESDTQVI